MSYLQPRLPFEIGILTYFRDGQAAEVKNLPRVIQLAEGPGLVPPHHLPWEGSVFIGTFLCFKGESPAIFSPAAPWPWALPPADPAHTWLTRAWAPLPHGAVHSLSPLIYRRGPPRCLWVWGGQDQSPSGRGSPARGPGDPVVMGSSNTDTSVKQLQLRRGREEDLLANPGFFF